MRKSKLYLVTFSFAALFLLTAAAYTLTSTWTNEVHQPLQEEKVVPPGWCGEHGYIAIWNPEDPYVCIRCE